MSYDMPDNSVERKVEVPVALKEFMARDKIKFEVTPEEVENFNRFVNLSPEELATELYGLKAKAEEIAWELIEATGTRYEELDVLNTELWRELAVCQAAINAKKSNS